MMKKMNLPDYNFSPSEQTKGGIPLTPMQEGMIFDSIRDGVVSRYVSLLHYRLPHPVNPSDLCLRWNMLARYHPSLRTCFHMDRDGNLMQTFPQARSPGFRLCNLSGRSGQNQEKSIQFYFKTAREKGLNPFEDTLCHLVLFDNGQADTPHVRDMGIIFHHAVLDGWSLSIILQQLLAQDPPRGRSVSFSRYIRFLHNRGIDSDLAYWRTRLQNMDRPCFLPAAHKPQAKPPKAFQRNHLRFEVPDSPALYSLARGLRLSPGRMLMAVWALVLSRYNDGKALFGQIISGRMGSLPGVMEMVGMCVNTIPACVVLPEESGFSAWLKEFNTQATADERHGFASPARLTKCLPSGVNYTDHLFVVDPPPGPESPVLMAGHGDPAAGFIAGFELGRKITACFSFDPEQYDAEAVQRIRDHYCHILKTVSQNPDIRLKEISILPPEETALLLSADPPKGRPCQTLVKMWKSAVAAAPEKTALVFRNTRMSYAEADSRVEHMARTLAADGVRPGDRVALKLARSHHMVISALSVMRIGAAYLPMAPEWPAMRSQQVLNETSLVVDEPYLENIKWPCKPDNTPWLLQEIMPEPSDPAYIIMTSGTTGRPKGVVVAHQSAAQFCAWAMDHYQWQPGEGSAVQTGFAYDVALWGLYPALFSNGTVHILDEEIRHNLHRIRDYLYRENITHMDLPVAMAEEFMAQFQGDEIPPSLKFLATGGDALRRYTKVPYTVVNEYGPTECTVTCTCIKVTPGIFPIPIGSPLPGMRAYILDRQERLCPLGVPGELCFSGGQLAEGYLGDPDLTAEKFISNPFCDATQDGKDHQRLYKTGDLACWQGNYDNPRENLLFLGRMDNQVKINGFRVELGEIEAILESHPKICKAAAMAAEFSLGQKTLAAWVVCKKEDFDEDGLRFFLADKLSSHMIPSLVWVASLPLTPGGKIDFAALPTPDTRIGNLPCALPRTKSEKALAQILTDLLPGFDMNLVPSFLDAGGDSINAIRLAARMEQKGWRTALPDIMATSSLRELALRMVPVRNRVRTKSCDSSAWLDDFDTSLLPRPSNELKQKIQTKWGRNTGIFPPTPTQKMLLTQSVHLGPSAYAVLGQYCLPGHGLTAETIRNRLMSAARRHDILRALFVQDGDGEPWMVIPEHREPGFCCHEIFDPQTLARTLIRRKQQLEKGLDPFSDVLFSMELFCNPGRGMEMLLHYHHLILDGWSLGLLFQELFRPDPDPDPHPDQNQNQDQNQDPAQVPPAFRNFARWTRLQSMADSNRDDLWWEQRFPLKAVPADLPPWPKAPEQAEKKADTPIETIKLLGSAEFSRCRSAAKAMKVTPAALFMALWHLALERFVPGPGNMMFGFVSAGRPPLPGIDRLVGMCARTLPIMMQDSSGLGFPDLARKLQRQMDEIQSRWDIPSSLPGRLPRHLFAFESGKTDPPGFPRQIFVSGQDGYDLVVSCKDHPDTPGAILRFDASALAPERAKQIRTHFQTMVETVLKNPDQPAAEIATLPARETHMLLETFGRGQETAFDHPTVIHAFEKAVVRFPGNPALICGDETLGFLALDRWTDDIARRLMAKGAGKGKIVGAAMSRSMAGAAAALAIMKTGAAYFPLDPSWPRERIQTMLVQTSATVLVTDIQPVPDYPVTMMRLTHRDSSRKTIKESTPLKPFPSPDDPAYVICTSGTTGRPKATVLEHRALANQALWTKERFAPNDRDRILHTVAFSFDPSLWLMFPFWGAGACVEIVPLELNMDPGRLLAHLHKHNITLTALPARVGGMLFDHARRQVSESKDLEKQFPAGIRTMVLGGESPRKLGRVGFDIINVYGPTEACIQTTAFLIPKGAEATRVIGGPVANMRVYVLDRYQRLCPVGVEGELWVSGPQLARGYLGMPEETNSVFVPNPYSQQTGHDRIYCTGDRAQWLPDGNLEFSGRLDRQVKIRGHRVEPAEIQAVLQQAPGVAEAYILARDDRISGNRLDAYFIHRGKGSSVEQKQAFLRSRLPGYMVPVSFTPVPSWPLNQNGKLDTAALPLPAAHITPFAPPEGDNERALARAWEKVLGISGISREDNFFDLGGHSLLLLQVTGFLRKTHVIDMRDFFKTPVLKDLAATMQPAEQAPGGIEDRQHHGDPARTLINAAAYQKQVAEVDNLSLGPPRKLRQMVLTGATGYLGAFLLKEYYDHTRARIIIPVRGEHPKLRLLDNLTFYFGRACARTMVNDIRLDIWSGDLSLPGETRFLEKKIKGPLDLIVHSAAVVDHYGVLDRLIAGNVTATQNMLALAQTCEEALFVHISTFGAVNLYQFEESVTTLGPPALNAYARTKQQAEERVLAARDQGRPTMILRTGNLVLDTKNKKCPRAAEKNMFLRQVRMMGLTGLGSKNGVKIGYAFVDQAACAIRLIAGQKSLENQVFHIDNPHKKSLAQVLSMALPKSNPICLLEGDALKQRLEILIESGSKDKDTQEAAKEYLAWINQHALETAQGEIFLSDGKMDWTLAILNRLGFSWQQIIPKLAKGLLERALGLESEAPERIKQVRKQEDDEPIHPPYRHISWGLHSRRCKVSP